MRHLKIPEPVMKMVHIHEAFLAGVDIDTCLGKNKDMSIYAEARKNDFYKLNIFDQIKKFGYWNMKEYDIFPIHTSIRS